MNPMHVLTRRVRRRLAQANRLNGARGWRFRCSVCGFRARRFEPHGLTQRPNARCGRCGALERHRFIWSMLSRETDLFLPNSARNVLHFAPEKCFEPRFRAILGSGYSTADLMPGRADETLDITDLALPDATVDVVLCSHVLEHVPDDQSAMREIRRVLSPTGWAMICVPMHEGPTFEDSTITGPAEREAAFGQHDHVRVYGPDIAERLTAAGFTVSAVTPEALPGREVRRAALRGDERFYLVRPTSP